MLQYIGTDIISTIDPRSKGRIERLWRTFQDRLYKELKKQNITTIEKANQYIQNVFLPKYNTRFASLIDYNRNVFISVDENFDYNKELAVWSEHKVYHNCYLKYNNTYYVISKDGIKTNINTDKKVKVYTFIDGTDHILFEDEYYDLKPIKNVDITPKVETRCTKSIEEINASKAHKPSSNHPWVKQGLKKLSQGRALASLS